MTGANSTPSNGAGGAAAAYDPLLGTIVVFGDSYSLSATNDTWEYLGTTWINETPALAPQLPPALTYASLTWDPDWGGLILFGGTYGTGTTSNETWFFNGTWYNETGSISGAPTSTTYADVGYDPAFSALVLENGCTDAFCDGTASQTWMLENPGTGWAWENVTSALGSGGGMGSADNGSYAGQMAYDVSDGYMVHFGGQRIVGGGSLPVLNDTWILNSTGWWNISVSSAGCPVNCRSPDPSLGGSMTWDGQLDAIVMLEGFNASFAAQNATWVFAQGLWSPATARNPDLQGPPAVTFAAMPTDSSEIAPMLIGGAGCSPWWGCGNSTWVFEVPPNVTSPVPGASPAETGISVAVQASVQRGSGSGPSLRWSLFDPATNDLFGRSSSVNTFAAAWSFGGTFSYVGYLPGTYPIVAEVWDFFGLSGNNSTTLAVHAALNASPVLTASPGEAGTPVVGSAGASGGVGPFTYLWSFGDGASSTAADPTHTYLSAGSYVGWVNVTDSLGVHANASFTQTVYPALTVALPSAPPSTDVGLLLPLAGVAAGGSGDYTAYAWAFGDGATATTQLAPHAYSTAGTYTISLTVTDSLGFSASATADLVVHAAMTLGSIVSSPTSPTTGDEVTLNVSASLGTTPYTYLWSFGDGGTSTAPSPAHSFGKAGSYTVVVTVTDAVGASLTRTLHLTVKQPSLWTQLGTPPDLYALVGVAGAIVATVAVLQLRRRRRKGRQPEGEPPSSGPPGRPSLAAGAEHQTPAAPPGRVPPP